jgi:hypothetical protein
MRSGAKREVKKHLTAFDRILNYNDDLGKAAFGQILVLTRGKLLLGGIFGINIGRAT